MARIGQEELDTLKHEVPIQRVLEARGIELKKHGAKDLVGLCPLHNEQTPSFVLSPERWLWHCFGCDRGGDVISLTQQLEGVSFRQAVELLRAGYPATGGGLGTTTSSARPAKRSTVPKLPCPVEPDAEDSELLNQVMVYYHERLKRTPAALEYLEKRGLGSMEMVEHFSLGYSDRSLCYGLPAKNRKAGEKLRGRLQALGILRESGHELFRGALVVPIRDEQGRVVSAYGRKTGEHLREGTVYHLNLDGQMRGVFNVETLVEHKEIIVCEAILDALTFWCAGCKNAVATRGATGFTEEYLEAFVRHGVRRALIAFDRDAAGDRGALALAERLMGLGIECWRIEFARGMDANEYALKVKPAAKSLGDRIRKALWLGKGARPSQEPGKPGAAAEPGLHDAEEAPAIRGPQAPAARDERKREEQGAPTPASEPQSVPEPPAAAHAPRPGPGRQPQRAPSDADEQPELSGQRAPALACECGPEAPAEPVDLKPAADQQARPTGAQAAAEPEPAERSASALTCESGPEAPAHRSGPLPAPACESRPQAPSSHWDLMLTPASGPQSEPERPPSD